jgi:hypothetical protein
MMYLVAYTTNHERHETEWVCPEGYTTDKALESFKQQFPSAAVISIYPFTKLPPPTTAKGQ